MRKFVYIAAVVLILLVVHLSLGLQYDQNTKCGDKALSNKFVFSIDNGCKPYGQSGKYVFTFRDGLAARGACFAEDGRCTESRCDFSQPDGSFCAVGVGIDKGATEYGAICSSKDYAAWDNSSGACVECSGIYELGKYADQKDIYLSPESPRIDSSIMTLPKDTLGETRKTVESGCAIRMGSPLDVYWCDEYYPFSEGEELNEDQIDFYLDKGIFRPDSYRKVIKSEGDDFEKYEYSDPIPSTELPPIATECYTKNKFGQGKCAAYCGYDGQLHAMECVDDNECPDAFLITKDPDSSDYFPRYEIRRSVRHCTRKLPFECAVDSEEDLDDSRQACAAYGLQYIKAGEENVGEYPDTNTLGCCGDDVYANGRPKEFIRYRVVVGGRTDYSDVACCGGEDRCVYNGKCYKEGSAVTIDGRKAHCYNGVWVARGLDLYYGYPSYVELPKCGDYICDVSTGENCFTCPIDCSFDREFSSVEVFDKEVMHKGDKDYYPDEVGNYHNNSFDLTWSDKIVCAPYSNLKYKSLYGWTREKTNFNNSRVVVKCDSDEGKGCDDELSCEGLFWFKQSSNAFCVKASPGDKLEVELEDENSGDHSKIFTVEEIDPTATDRTKPFGCLNKGIVCFYVDVLGFDSHNVEEDYVDKIKSVKYIQYPKSVRSTCEYDSECESHNCAKFGVTGVCCPYGYKFNGEECYLPEQFDYDS